jgi:hypothetical protein
MVKDNILNYSFIAVDMCSHGTLRQQEHVVDLGDFAALQK